MKWFAVIFVGLFVLSWCGPDEDEDDGTPIEPIPDNWDMWLEK